MLTIRYQTAFKKDYKRIVRRGYDVRLLEEVITILAKRQIADKLIVPKTAVLPRQGRKVVFVYENGRAIWKYVETGFENSREVCIESGLKEGEEAIYENNLGLSHECEVTLINKKE